MRSWLRNPAFVPGFDPGDCHGGHCHEGGKIVLDSSKYTAAIYEDHHNADTAVDHQINNNKRVCSTRREQENSYRTLLRVTRNASSLSAGCRGPKTYQKPSCRVIRGQTEGLLHKFSPT